MCGLAILNVGRLSAYGIQMPKRETVGSYHELYNMICILFYCIEYIC